MQLAPDIVGPYLGALRAALTAHAPDEDFIPLVEIDHHLAAMSPQVSGGLLLPAEVDPGDGLPHHNWMSRVRAESVLAQEGGREAAAPRAALGQAIADRYAWRTALRAHLQSGPVWPHTRLVAHERYAGAPATYTVRFDHHLPGAGWMRISVDFRGDFEGSESLFQLQPDNRVTVDEGLRHLLLRHGVTPLLVLLQSLQSLMLVEVVRLSRTFVGPFWFPGFLRPQDAPEALSDTLTLHLFQELVGLDVHHSAHRDPWVPPTVGAEAPQGYGVFRERRLAVPRAQVESVRTWADARGGAVVVGF